MKNVRTRYAPSPTGYLHIGGARTALFSYLFAKHNGGKFIVRIEDTDIKRNIKDAGKKQLENLIWLGITPDESPLKPNPKYGPYSQMKKVKRYLEIAKTLIDSKKAYIAFENFEELEKQKLEQKKRGIKSFRYDRHWLKISDKEKKRRLKNNEYSIRLSLPKNKNYSWEDLVRGKMQFNSDDVGDFIIIKTNKLPTYNFAVVVDDHDMAISHVLRGEEHISNTPKQLAIYEALKWKAPEFGHLTIITNLEGRKISKRDKDIKQYISQYRNDGVLPEAIFLYLAFLGWTHPQAKEIISKEELIKAFDYKRLSKSPSKFDTKKMLWFSSVMIKKMKNEEIEKLLEIPRNKKWINFFIETYKDSVSTLNDFYTHFELYKNEGVKKITLDNVVSVFKNILEKLPFTYLNIKKAIELTKKKTNCAGKKLFLPLRKAITYESEGPELARAIFLLGEDLVKKEIKHLMTITFHSEIKNFNGKKNSIKFTSALTKSKYKDFDVYEFIEPAKKMQNRIEISKTKVNIFSGNLTLNLELNKFVANNFVSGKHLISLNTKLLSIKKSLNKVILKYKIFQDEKVLSNYKLTLTINE